MHKSNPPQELPQSFLDQAYERARQRLIAAAQQVTPEPVSSAADLDSEEEPHAVEPLLSGAALRRVLREPLAWLLSLAQGLAMHDPHDVAAVQRVRAATIARLAGRPAGFRATDVLTVFALLFGALDPTIVFTAVSGALSEGFAAVLTTDLPPAVFVTSIPDPRMPHRARLVCTHPGCPLQAHVGR